MAVPRIADIVNVKPKAAGGSTGGGSAGGGQGGGGGGWGDAPSQGYIPTNDYLKIPTGVTATPKAATPTPAPITDPGLFPFGGGGGYVDPGIGIPGAGMSGEDWLVGDKVYQAQLLALKEALENYEADNTSQRSKYETQYGDAMKNLGWGVPDNTATVGIDESNPNDWNWQDQTTAAGRANTSQMNDFASRGLLQSSLFAAARSNLLRSLLDQKTSMDTSRQNFLDESDSDLRNYQSQNKNAQQQAQAEALQRRAQSLFAF